MSAPDEPSYSSITWWAMGCCSHVNRWGLRNRCSGVRYRYQRKFVRAAIVCVRRMPVAFAQRLSGLLFDLDLPQVGEEGFIHAPQPLLQASLDAVYRVANSLKRKRAELSTAEVLARLTREIERWGA